MKFYYDPKNLLYISSSGNFLNKTQLIPNEVNHIAIIKNNGISRYNIFLTYESWKRIYK